MAQARSRPGDSRRTSAGRAPPCRENNFRAAHRPGSEADRPVRVAKLVLTETIASPSQTRSPSTDALARSRMRSTSSSERRWSRISSTTAAVANPMIAKLASATPTASQPAGKADCGNLDRRVGNDRHRAHRGEMMAADRERQQNGAADLPLSFVAMKADRKRDGTDRPAQHDRGNHERGIPQDHALRFRRLPCQCSAWQLCRRQRWRRRATARGANPE